jgi:hypothetical protein
LREREEESKGDHKYYQQEKAAEAKFDQFANQLAKRYKIEVIPWLRVTQIAVYIFLVLVLLQMLKRNCFLSLTVAALAIYVLEEPASIGRHTFRVLVALLALSWVYDFVQVFLIDASAAEEDEEDGGNEYMLRRFVRLITYIALFFKIILVLVFWKDSLDFRNIIKGKSSAQDEDQELEDILAQVA